MKLSCLLILVTSLQLSAKSYSQEKVTLNLKTARFEKLFKEIEKQTQFRFVYSNLNFAGKSKITLNVANAAVVDVLDNVFKNTDLGFKILNANLIVVSAKNETVQEKTITGKVMGPDNEPLSGVSVFLKNSRSVGTSTDNAGMFKLTVPDNAKVLVFSYVDMEQQEVDITGASQISVTMKAASKVQDEVVVVGYGTQKKTSLTASVSTIKGSDIAEQPVADLSNALGGRATGVLFTQPSGQAGNDAADIMIRGVATTGNHSPLFIVDGVPRNFSQLNPADIESITVLKDAAAVAPYGMGGANGVLLITTKKGKNGRPRLTYDGYVGYQNPTVVTQFVNSYDYARMKNEGALNQGSATVPYSATDLELFKNHTDPDGHPDVQAFKDIFKKNTLQTGHSLTLSGGTDVIKYAMGLGFFDQEGLLPGIQYKRYNLSGSMQAQATKTTLVSLSINGRVEDRDLTPAGYNSQSLFENISYGSAVSTPYVFSNGLHSSLYASLYDNSSYKKITGNTVLTQFSIEQKLPVKGLSVKFVGSYDLNPYDPFSVNNGIEGLTRTWNAPYTFYNLDTTQHPYAYPAVTSPGLPSFSEAYHQTQAFTYQGFVNYGASVGKSAFTGLVVLESRNTKSSSFSAGRLNYNLPIQQIFAGGSAATDQSTDGTSLATKQASLVYRGTYSYNNKYLFEAAGRYDGNYTFAPGHRFGFFPAFSAGWRISQESFMQDISWLNELKLKGSYGKSGQINTLPFQYQSGFNLYGSSSVLNGTLTQGLAEATEANPNITWETAKKADIGLEATILKNSVHIEFDYFNENRSDMLVTPNVTVPSEYGVGLSQVNAGSMNNKGFELTIDYNRNITKDLRIGLNANFSYAKNKLVQVFENPATYNVPGLRQTGRPLGTQFGYQAIGFFSANDFDASGNLKPGIANQTWSALAPGEIRYADLSGANGKPDGVIDYHDEIPLGYPQNPFIVYGFSPSVSYKNFSLSLLFQGAADRQIQLGSDAVLAFNNNKNAPITALDYWTPTHTDATSPRILPSPSTNTAQPSTLWERSAAYLRLRTGLLSYTLPAGVLKAVGANFVKVYVSGQNILTWTPLKNFDPEIANSGQGLNGINSNNQRAWYFPTQKAITFGLSIQF